MVNEASTEMSNGYFRYLGEIVGADTLMRGNYWYLLKTLHSMEFYWIIDRDENRARDGENLRVKYFYEVNSEDTKYDDILYRPCTVLEMLVALAIRIEGITAGWEQDSKDRTADWFWEMVRNLDLMDCSDDNWSENCRAKVQYYIQNFMDRKYETNGVGGLFPLKSVCQNQRRVEVWYQMQAYIQENY